MCGMSKDEGMQEAFPLCIFLLGCVVHIYASNFPSSYFGDGHMSDG